MDIVDGITHLHHASVKIEREKVIYLDPFKIENEPHDADFIFCTHDHFDHLSPDDIKKVMKETPDTILVVPEKNAKKFKKFGFKEVVGVEPGKDHEAGGLTFKTVPSYNVDKKFHPKKKKWLGFILCLESGDYYFAGDTDYIPEMDNIKADLVFLPVGGTYTATAQEAAKAANVIKPKVAVPIHFGSVVGTSQDAEIFIQHLDKDIQGVILLKH
jgi:L-ascorbate metabolism protein UlaG (beta-lactamase superfamily)